MRTIKFRGKRVRNREWVYGYYFDCNNGNSFIKQTIDENGVLGNEDFMVLDFTVGQFTGLTDKNGKEIYEGDIVVGGVYYGWKNEKGKAIVMYGEFDVDGSGGEYGTVHCLGFYLNILESSIRFLDTQTPSIVDKQQKPNTLEVIGNIHDNPELINA